MKENEIPELEAAKFLGIPPETLNRWMRQGVIHAYSRNGKIYFNRNELVSWARVKRIGIFKKNISPGVCSEDSCNITASLCNGEIHHEIEGKTTADILRNCVEKLNFLSTDPEESKAKLYKSLMEREALASTGIGNGIAIPHARQPAPWDLPQPHLSIFFTKDEVDFNSIDGEPVYVIFILLCSTVKGHIQMLSKISHLLHLTEFQDFLRTHPDAKLLQEKIQQLIPSEKIENEVKTK